MEWLQHVASIVLKIRVSQEALRVIYICFFEVFVPSIECPVMHGNISLFSKINKLHRMKHGRFAHLHVLVPNFRGSSRHQEGRPAVAHSLREDTCADLLPGTPEDTGADQLRSN